MSRLAIDMSPRIRGYEDYDAGLDAIADLLATGNERAPQFFYDHYSAFSVSITRHRPNTYALTVGYTGRPRRSLIWEPVGTDPWKVAGRFEINPGPDVRTLGCMLRDLASRLPDLKPGA